MNIVFKLIILLVVIIFTVWFINAFVWVRVGYDSFSIKNVSIAKNKVEFEVIPTQGFYSLVKCSHYFDSSGNLYINFYGTIFHRLIGNKNNKIIIDSVDTSQIIKIYTVGKDKSIKEVWPKE